MVDRTIGNYRIVEKLGRSSYVFIYVAGDPDSTGRVTSFSLRAEPTHFEEGVVRYCSDQTGTIRWTSETRGAAAQDKPVQ